MSIERIASWNDLVSFLTKEKVPHQKNDADRSVQIPVELEDFHSQLYLRWEANLPYVQAVCPVHVGVPDDRVAAVESAIARLNHAIALPGFGYDHVNKFVYFRLTITVEPAGMDANFFGLMARAVMNNAHDFHGAIVGVVHGDPPEGALAVAAAKNQGAKAAAANPAYNE
jgi:hypothetical protein